MRKVRKAVDHNANGLSELIRHLERLSASDDEAKASLTAFASLAALIMIRNLKRGFDWSEEGAPQPWFEAYKFNSDPSYCLLDWVPRQSPTGRAVFNFRYWVGARVGHEKHYEYVMFPLKSVLPLFRDGVEGNTEAFYRWVLPQLVLLGAYKPIEEFPVADWEPFLLQGANATEWWSRYSPCPWPEVVGPIDMVEL
jgi:hypothetical protein